MAFDIRTAKPAQTSGFDLSSATPDEQPVYVQNEGDFVPTDENLAAAVYPEEQDRSIGEQIIGAGETALTLATGATGGAAGFISAVPKAVAGELSGRLKQGEGLQEASQRASDFTYAPTTEAGQEYTGELGEALSVLPPVLASTPMSALKAPKVRRGLKTPKPTVTEVLESTPTTRKTFDRKTIESQFSQSTFMKVKEARRQGFDEAMTTVIADASPNDKRNMNRQVALVVKGKENELFKAENSPRDVAGASLLREIEFIDGNKSQAGKQLGRVAEKLKGKPIDISEHTNNFKLDLEDMGVDFDDNGTPNFDIADFGGLAGDESLVKKVLMRIKRNPPKDALSAHKLKTFLDKHVNYGKRSADGIDPKTAQVVKKLRAGINTDMGLEFKTYKEANTRFADAITALDDLQSSVGNKVDLKGPNADKALGIALRRITSHAASNIPMRDAVANIQATAKKYGGDFDNDIMTQVLFADELDAMFGGGGRTSLRGEVKNANVDAALDLSQMSIPGALVVGAKAGAKKIAGINEKNQLIAIKKLLSQK